MAVSISIIIISYNVRYFLEQCLLSVRRATAGLAAQVIVVDNRSADDTLVALRPLFPEVLFIDAGVNLGFAKACNLGFRHATGQHLLFLNPDTLLAEDSLQKVLRFVQHQPHAGAVGVRMIDGSGRFLKESKRGLPTPLASLFKLCGLARLFPHSRLFSRYYLGHRSAAQNQEVDVVAGAFMFIPRPVLEKVGLFDEAFFMYAEDIDLSYRIQQAGYRNYYIADATIIHFKGESTPLHSARYVHTFYKAMDLFVRKHYGGRTNSVFRHLLRLAIWVRAGLSWLVQPVKSLRSTANSKQQPLAVYASDKVYALLEKAFARQGIGTIRLHHLADARMLAKGQQLVLCTSRQALAQYIQWMANHPADIHLLFHLEGGSGVVGSHRAEGKGCYFTLPIAAGVRPQPFSLVN